MFLQKKKRISEENKKLMINACNRSVKKKLDVAPSQKDRKEKRNNS